MEKPVLSQNFTIDDIHRLREYNYNMTKDLSMQEALDYYNKKGMSFQEKIERSRKAKKAREMVEPGQFVG